MDMLIFSIAVLIFAFGVPALVDWYEKTTPTTNPAKETPPSPVILAEAEGRRRESSAALAA